MRCGCYTICACLSCCVVDLRFFSGDAWRCACFCNCTFKNIPKYSILRILCIIHRTTIANEKLIPIRQKEQPPAKKEKTGHLRPLGFHSTCSAHLGPYAAGPVSYAFHRCFHASHHLPTAFTHHSTRSLREQCVHLALGPLQYSCQPQIPLKLTSHKFNISSGSIAV
jgi:hypothetical protein